MARKKRKYIRRKPLRQDVMPASTLLLGLLPFLLLASLTSIYFFIHYLEPEAVVASIAKLELPEVTIAFDEVIEVLGLSGSHVAQLAGDTGTMIVSTLTEGLISFKNLIVDTSHSFVETTVMYAQVVAWTSQDFIAFLDIPGKFQAIINAILWPLQFLNPQPLITAVSEKAQEAVSFYDQLMFTLAPIIDIIRVTFQKFMDGLLQGLALLSELLKLFIDSL